MAALAAVGLTLSPEAANPAGRTAGVAGASGPVEPAHQLRGLYTTMHVARAGDSVGSLVQEYHTTRGALESLNPGLNLENIKPGDRVYVMSRPGVFQKVQAGLTISDVARAYQVNSEYLLRVNDIANPKKLTAGRELFIPDGLPLPRDRMTRLMQKRKTRVWTPRGSIGNPLGTSGPLVVSDGYGKRRHPITGETQFHAGIDLVAPWGTPVLSVKEGTVAHAGWKGGYGKLVIINHPNGMSSYYGHLTEMFVKEGDTVTEGQLVGKVGATGDVTGPHLHFELRMEGSARNPSRYLSRYF